MSATSYIPTTTTPVTRAASIATITPTTWYNTLAGTWVVSGDFNSSSVLDGSGVWISNAEGNGNIVITYDATGAKVFSSGALQFITPMSPAGEITLADSATLASVKYYPRQFSDTEAQSLATGAVTLEYSPQNLFNSGEQGVWYDPSDTTTLFQDSAGTTPVTASGQPVGLMLDKSGRGHHATQPTAASRPIYRRGDSRGVVNQLLNTETLATQSGAVTAVGHTLSFTGTGSITLSGASTAGPLVGTGVNDRVSLAFTPTAGSLTLTVSGSVTKGQLNLGSTALPYQRNDGNLGGVATGASTDLHWLETDGVDDGMVTGNIDFTGTDKVSMFAGVRKLSDAARGVLVELSTSTSTNNGSLGLEVPDNPGTTVAMRSRGTLTVNAVAVIATAPVSLIMSSVNNIAGDVCSLRSNGSIVATNAANQGTGNYGNYPLYLFRRGGTSLPFNGWFYGLAITGRLTTDAETVATERYLAAKASVVLP